MKGTSSREAVVASLVALLALAGCTADSGDGPCDAADSDCAALCLAHVTVIDPRDGSTRADMTVAVDGETISAVIPAADIAPRCARTTDQTGRYVIPGLADMHTHLTADPANLKLFVAHGVTLVRDMGSLVFASDGAGGVVFPELDAAIGEVLDARAATADRTLLGPTIVTPGSILTGPLPPGAPWDVLPWQWDLDTEAEARAAVGTLHERGVDFIKVHTLPSREVYFAIVDEAPKHGLTVAGHVPVSITAAEAAQSGQRSIEHLTGMWEYVATPDPDDAETEIDEARFAELMQLFKAHDTWHVPTLAVYEGLHGIAEFYADPDSDPRMQYTSSELLDWWTTYFPGVDYVGAPPVSHEQLLVGRMAAAGIRFMTGTDLAVPRVFAGLSLHDELRLLVGSGLSPLEALQAATTNPAEFLGITDLRGTVEAGKLADLVLLDRNPLEDITNTMVISGVMLRGQYFSRADLDDLLAEVAAESVD